MYRDGKIGKIYLTVSASKNGVSMASAMRDFIVEQGVCENEIAVERNLLADRVGILSAHI